MRVLQVFTPGTAGGLESVVQMLAPGLRDRGVTVGVTAVLIGDSPEPPSVSAIRAAGVPVFVHRQGPRGYLSEWSNHRNRIAEFGADLVHSHGFRADLLAGRAAGPKVRKVSTVHGFTGGDWKLRMYERLQIRSYRDYDAVVAVSRSVVTRLEGQGVRQPKVVLLPNAWTSSTAQLTREEARRTLSIPPDATVAGWVGRLSPEKGADVLIDAAARLRETPIRFSIVGDGPERAGLAARAAQLGVADRITWHGLIASAGRLMPAFDLFVLSSRTEGTPIALFEAMAAGVPVVATAVGGVPDVLATDEAWLIPSEAPAELASAIQTAVADPSEARSRADRAAEHLRTHYAAGPWLDRHIDLYSRLIAGKSASLR